MFCVGIASVASSHARRHAERVLCLRHGGADWPSLWGVFTEEFLCVMNSLLQFEFLYIISQRQR